MIIDVATVARFVGRTVDDDALRGFVDAVRPGLSKKLPKSRSTNSMKYVVATREGLEMGFVPDILHPAYPVVPKNKASSIPRLSIVWLTKKFPGWGSDAVFGLPASPSEEALRRAFGEPSRRRGVADDPCWVRVLDAERAIVLEASPGSNPSVQVDEGRRLGPLGPQTVLFAAWALEQGWLAGDFVDGATRERLLSRELPPTALAAGLGRGLWDTHLAVPEATRSLTFAYFHRLAPADGSWRADLMAHVGERTNAHGHREAALDLDGCTWERVDEVAGTLIDKLGASPAEAQG